MSSSRERGGGMSRMKRRTVIVAAGGGAASAAIGGAALRWAGSPGGPTLRSGQETSFGSVALLGSAGLTLAPPTGAHHHGALHQSADPVPSAVHGAWTDAVVVDVEVHNGSSVPVELSPGQFRVRVDGDGPTVSLYDADRDAGPLRPRSTTTMRIRYLAPTPEHRVSLEFADMGADTTVQLGTLDRREEGRA